uniref:Zinc finger-XS domain-containing protein n=1 Tax=Acidobacterium capsulatum TaxID=33075 RepID=A0A7V4XT76_9BACT
MGGGSVRCPACFIGRKATAKLISLLQAAMTVGEAAICI